MSRDMKPRKRAAPARKKSGGGMLVGLFLGLVIGVLIAAGVVWYIFKTPAPFSNKVQPAPSAAAAGAANGTPLALPGKPGDPIPAVNASPANGAEGDTSGKPRFDFYKILPGNADAVPGQKPADPKQVDTKTPEQKPADEVKAAAEKENLLKDPLFLQTGSFQNPGDADNQKAKLAMMGMEANVQQVMVQEKVWYRVRLGPFRKMEDINRMRSELAGLGLEANVVKKD